MSLPNPITRIEKYMAKAAGMDVDTPEPITRREQYWDAIANGYTPPPVETTVTGVSPLLLAGAAARGIVSLTQYGLCTQASTPTPSDPVPIKCNNGTIVARRQSGLPTGYQLLEYLVANKAVMTSRKTTDNTEIRCKIYRLDASGQYGYSSDGNSSLTTNTTAYLSRPGNWRFGNKTAEVSVAPLEECITKQNKYGVWLNDSKVATYSGVGTFESTDYLKILGTLSTGAGTRMYWLEHYESDVLVAKYVPVKRLSDNAYGFYDLVGDAFYTNAEATFTPGNAVSDPVSIVAVGTPESISITASGAEAQTATAENLLSCGNYADEQEIISGAVTRKVGVLVINGTEDWGYYGDNVFAATGVLTDMDEGADDIGICTHYEVGATCNIYNGEFDIWDERFSTASEFTAFLAAQYAAGTPVIVLYPLAEPTTESVTAQPLETADGDNTITVTANVSGMHLSTIYMKGA